MTWSGTRLVAVGWGGAIFHSDAGDRWEEATDSGQDDLLDTLHAVAWNGDRYVAVGEAAILHSSDGERWDSVRGDDVRQRFPRRHLER